MSVTGGESGDWQRVAATNVSTCGLRGGTLWCWGDGISNVPGPVGSEAVWAGLTAGDAQTCGLRAGTLWCWGWRGTPAQVGTDVDWGGVAVGTGHTCGLRSGAMWCWGDNSGGQIGNGYDHPWRRALLPQRVP